MSKAIIDHPLFAPLLQQEPPQATTIPSLPGGGSSWLAASLARGRKAPVVLVTGKSSRAEAIYRELLFFNDGARLNALSFPAWETLPFESLSPFGALVGDRLASLYRMIGMRGDGPIFTGQEDGEVNSVIITTPAALMQRLPPPSVLADHGFSFSVGDQLDLPRFREMLTHAGYNPVSQVSEPGEFAARGGLVDFFPPGRDEPVRVDLFGDEVDAIRLFDPTTQRSGDAIPRVEVLPVREVILSEESIRTFRTTYRESFGGGAAEDLIYKEISQGRAVQGMEQLLPLFYEETATLFDYLPEGSLFLMEPDWQEAAQARQQEIEEQHAIAFSAMKTGGDSDHTTRCLARNALYLERSEVDEMLTGYTKLLQSHDKVDKKLALALRPIPSLHDEEGQEGAPTVMAKLEKVIRSWRKEGRRIALALRTVGQRERMREILQDHKLACEDGESWRQLESAKPGTVQLILGDVGDGFDHPDSKRVLISEGDVFGARIRRRQPDQRYLDQLIASFADLSEGDPVVHTDHGVGLFGGLHPMDIGGLRNDFLLIQYAESDKLYVPVENLDRVGKHSGSGEEVQLNRLGTTRWKKTRQKARKKILAMAEDLVQLQAKRASAEGYAFAGPDALYQEFAATFPFEETPDQATAIDAVLSDMASESPMDRLVCGDVGFGKTEVALRATFRAAMDGKQVAVLVPTTILAQQHFENFTKRLAGYPIRVELLSRFRTPKQQKAVIEALNDGKVDVIVGTHRLLQSDIKFTNLGLLVVDEEQRFGVTHKEKIKTLRAAVDILTLTATPIPRTLNMAMAGVRDISIIASPPVDRLAIRTIVTYFEKQQVREAVLRELYRGGQVFYVHNQVQDIDRKAQELADLIPEARVGVAHGQMRENQLEKVMMDFYRQTFNVLVCTTIVENGVDIPTANTIIIDRADKFGLAQLHQLRGRVGRSKHRAYAYMLIPHRKRISKDAEKRLTALESLGELGAGFMLATHDLEIRGAGNILGDEQSGQIKEVGFELYNQMLKEAVTALKAARAAGLDEVPSAKDLLGEEEEQPFAPAINLHLSTYIPDDYVADVHQRLTLYKRIAELASYEELEEMRVELADRFGPIPETVDNLLHVMNIKRLCIQLRIQKLDAGPKGGSFQFHESFTVDPARLIALLQREVGMSRMDQNSRTLVLNKRNWQDAGERLGTIRETLISLA
uniref:Transcription-repair-coupling factor n=1 Tax=Magnetococcus massalia (strain MO-1) TaxID=451514 RepID=A0A1S7LGP2_MAGMO|nr:Transcription-repair-coupling factor [Candidatus Magnetococcus massalia]